MILECELNKQYKKIDINELITLCELGENYKIFCTELEELKELSSYIENDKIYSKLDQIYMIEKYGEKQKILENIKKSLENLNSIDLLEDTLSYIKTKEKVKKIDELVNKK